MAKIAIVTDSNSGITQAEGKQLGVYVLPMPFDIDGQQYFAGWISDYSLCAVPIAQIISRKVLTTFGIYRLRL